MMILTEHTCTICDGPLEYMGTLGMFHQAKCRNCGWIQSVDIDEEEDPCEA